MTSDLAQIIASLKKDGVERVRLGGFDVDGILRGKYISIEKFESAAKKGLGFCDVIFGWDSADELYDNVRVTGWHTGYPDTMAKIELDTLRQVPWDNNTPFFLLDFYEEDGAPLEVSPRQVLRKVLAQADEMGFDARLAMEFEFFIFDETPQSVRDKDYRDPTPITPGMFGYSALRASSQSDFIREVFTNMRSFGIPIEGFHTETGPGVYEAAIAHDLALPSADKAALFKTAMKELCYRHDRLACFMAKWNQALPGSSGHTHQSLWSKESGTNVFADSRSNMSETFRWYLGGLCAHLPELTAMFCPTVNSYKRLVPGMWAPTNVTWGFENRTVALRVIPGTGPNQVRVENRIVGADANPYLSFAANLAAGLQGIKNQIEPPAPITGNGYEIEGAGLALPASLHDASKLFRKSQLARDWFGAKWVDNYASTRDWEWREFQKAVTDWELRRYFEII